MNLMVDIRVAPPFIGGYGGSEMSKRIDWEKGKRDSLARSLEAREWRELPFVPKMRADWKRRA
jgi:hypothetical protein